MDQLDSCSGSEMKQWPLLHPKTFQDKLSYFKVHILTKICKVGMLQVKITNSGFKLFNLN